MGRRDERGRDGPQVGRGGGGRGEDISESTKRRGGAWGERGGFGSGRAGGEVSVGSRGGGAAWVGVSGPKAGAIVAERKGGRVRGRRGRRAKQGVKGRRGASTGDGASEQSGGRRWRRKAKEGNIRWRHGRGGGVGGRGESRIGATAEGGGRRGSVLARTNRKGRRA